VYKDKSLFNRFS